jgi:hypothetical protein
MRLGTFKFNSPEFQCMRNNYAKYTFHCVFAIITQWFGQYIVFGAVIFLWQILAVLRKVFSKNKIPFFKRISSKFLNFPKK